MDHLKAKFCLSRRVEEYYFEESLDGQDDSLNESEYSTICNLIHQRALNRSKQLEIKNRLNGYFNQRPNYTNYTSDGDSLYTNSSNSQLSQTQPQNSFAEPRVSSSFNRRKFDLIQNKINYFKPAEAHKQRQSDIFPLERYDQIMQDSPFDSPVSPINKDKRRATVLPTFKAFNEQSTQTSFDRYENVYRNSIHQSVNQSIKRNTLVDKSTQNSINRSGKNETKLRDASNRTPIEKPNKHTSKRKSKTFYDKSHYLTNAIIEEPDDESRRNLGHTEVIESLASGLTLSDTSRNLTRSSLSFSKRSNNFENNSNKFNDKSSMIKNTSGNSKNLTKRSNTSKSINKIEKSEKSSLLSKDLLNLDSGSKSTSMKSKRKSRSLKVLRSSSASNRTHESQRKSMIKKSIDRIKSITKSKIDELSDVSLILNSTKESNDENELIESKAIEATEEVKENLHDISVIGFETSLADESNVEIVFDDETDVSKITNEPVASKNLTNLTQLSKIEEEIELQRNSVNQASVPELSLVETSISETLSQPESTRKSLGKKSLSISKSKSINKSKQPTSTNLDLSVDFNTDYENDDLKSVKEKSINDKIINELENSPNNNRISSLRSTPKSILKSSSRSKRNWEASDFSLINLTVGSANKSISNHSSAQKANSVRFSDKISEKFTNEILSSQKEEDEIALNKSAENDKSKDDKIEERSSKAKDPTDLPDLNDYSNDEKSKSLSSKEKSLNKEAEKSSIIEKIDESEESLNVTIDDLSLLDEELENESLNATPNDKTPTNQTTKNQSTFIVKSLKKPERKKNQFKKMVKKFVKVPKYYETFVDKTPTIIYPRTEEDEEEEETSIRRSKRIRVRPLDFWRSQKPKYKLDENTKCLTIEGIDKGFAIDNPFRKRRTRSTTRKQIKQKKRKQQESDDESDDENVRVKVKKVRYEPNEISIHQEINNSAIQISEKIKKEATEFCSQNDLQWTESKQSKGVFMAFMSRKKDSNGNTQATGFMKLTSLLKKPTQKSANYVTRYVVMFGCASVIIGDKPPVILKSMDSFVVNQNTHFSIDNLRKDELLLYFDVSKS